VQTRRTHEDSVTAPRRSRTANHAKHQRSAHGRAPNAAAPRAHGLANWRVRSKLIVVLVIPALAFLVVASIAIGSTGREVSAFGSGRRLAELGRQVTALVHEVQSERDVSAGYIQSGHKQRAADIPVQRQRVDDLAAAYREAEGQLYDDFGPRLMARFDEVRSRLDDLGPLRAAIDLGALTDRGAFNEYSGTVAALLDINREIAQGTGDEDLAQTVRAFNDLSSAKEAIAQVRGSLYSTLVRGRFTSGEFQALADLLAQERAAFAQFEADANERQRSLYSNGLTGQAVLAAQRIQDATLSRQANQDLQLDPEQWYAATSTQIEQIRGDEERLLGEVIDRSRSLNAAAQRRLALEALLIALILAVALLALAVVARSMARPLQDLRSAALDIADHRLPAAVKKLRTSATGRLDVDVEPIGINSTDEIGQVAQAVNAIQRVAVRVATEQAALRRSIGDMFTNLARRSQTLIDRQLELIDELERTETDPQTLQHLFRLDHLATRMRRNAEDLIVLSGADPGQHWATPMTLVDVIRAATSEVEEYQRVELLALPEVEVVGHATIDLIHLLAELIENATAFSPPSTQVQIAGQAVGHGYVLEIEDRGLGMTDEELAEANERLANPPEIDFALSQMLGLYVVGRLAQRHGIMVQLRRSWYGGVTALTMLPYPLLLWPGGPPIMTERTRTTQSRSALPRPQRQRRAPEGPNRPPSIEPTRSEWFTPEREYPAAQPPDQPEAVPRADRAPTAEVPPTPPPPAVPAPASTAEEAPMPSPAAPEQAPAEAGPRLTGAGLPRRVPRTNFAPGLADTADRSGPMPVAGADGAMAAGRHTAEPGPVATRSPEELREVLSGYRSGLEHGRLAADELDTSQPTDETP
jgi:hypothetical protein